MAYAGTPTGLAQQAGTSRPWKTMLAAIAVLAIGLALVIAVMFNSRAVAPTTGRDDSVIEAQRDATLLSGKPAAGVPAASARHRSGDRSRRRRPRSPRSPRCRRRELQ